VEVVVTSGHQPVVASTYATNTYGAETCTRTTAVAFFF